jgi:hypothetical protein
LNNTGSFSEVRSAHSLGTAQSTSQVFVTELALVRADIEEIRHVLHGDGKGRKGLADKVAELVAAADRGCFSYRVVLWLGGGILAAVTAVAQFRQALMELFRQ